MDKTHPFSLFRTVKPVLMQVRSIFNKNKNISGLVVVVVVVALSYSFLASAAPTTIFSDGFESNDFSLWTAVDSPKWATGGNAASSHTGSRRALITGNTNPGKDALRKNKSTIGFQNLVLQYWF